MVTSFMLIPHMGQGTNNQSEVEVGNWGLSCCLNNEIQYVISKIDYELLIRWIRGQTKPHWHLQHFLESHNRLFSYFQLCICGHIYREANFVANSLSKINYNISHPCYYITVQQLPIEVKGYFNPDKMGVSNLKRRKLRSIKVP